MATSLHFHNVRYRLPNSSNSTSLLRPSPLFSRQKLTFNNFHASSLNLYSNCPSRTMLQLQVCCSGSGVGVEGLVKDEEAFVNSKSDDGVEKGLTCVMKFGGSSVASAERMREVAELVCSFPEERPVVVLSAMGKTTNKLLLAGEKAVSCGVSNTSEIDELGFIKDLHLRTTEELGIDQSVISGFLVELEQLLKGIAMMKELTLRTKDYLVSFGECMSTRIFAAYLNKIGVKARQYDAFEMGITTTDDFTNADILGATYPAVAKHLHGDWVKEPAIPVVTGFLGKDYNNEIEVRQRIKLN